VLIASTQLVSKPPKQRCVLVDNFFRPLPGYNNVTFSDNAFSSNYHALLLSLNRRFTRGLQLGVAYTYAKYMSYTGFPIYRPIRTWSYGPDSSDETHNVVVNFGYEPPKLSGLLPNPVVRWVFDGWMLSGIGQWVSGTPNGITLTTTDGTDLTGGGDGQRVNVVDNAAEGGSTFTSGSTPRHLDGPAREIPATRPE